MKHIEHLVNQVEMEAANKTVAPQRLISCLDLTSLNTTDNEATINALCEKAQQHQVAAVCVYPAFVSEAAAVLKNGKIKIATVANFPFGNLALTTVLTSIDKALQEGACEIDVVIPYQQYLDNHNLALVRDFVRACKQLLPTQCLKVILESGAITDLQLLESVALACLEAGADFLKTSTGKVAQGASLDAAAVMLNAIQRFGDMKRGFKASGGVKNYEQANKYYLLAQIMIGESWPNCHTFRIGASSLLDDLLQKLN